ncbi:FAD binding domain in molybdopterin dehydrogenase [uncultured Eubacteriales bacterium]|uniref:FAD binding domain in molybdopterin dehydrogenase n=1 Tax=uncultured Eubacteriales bacterium TaxID=172733 RepID=A0A212KBN1_9FIRM|nr:FAD binding domain in molybdopterin dehydrogenase [uncultured Eubacteriales bacterium]
MRPFEYYAPTSLEEAFALLAHFGPDAKLLNGGTDVVIQLRDRLIAPRAVIDIKRIPGLNSLTFSEKEGLTIGACVTANALGGSPFVRERYPALGDAALSLGSKQVRNRATCIGNIVNASPLADTATPLLAHGAVVITRSSVGAREVPLEEFFISVRKTSLRPEEIVTSIRVPYLPGCRGVFLKVSRRREVDLSTVCVTCLTTPGGWRIAFGAVAPTPIRLRKTEALLDSQPLAEEVIRQAVELARTEVSPIDDVRASKAYRLEVVGVVLARGLRALM